MRNSDDDLMKDIDIENFNSDNVDDTSVMIKHINEMNSKNISLNL